MEDFEDDPRGDGSSIAAPLIRALLAAAVAFGIYWLVFGLGDADPAEDLSVVDPTEAVDAPTVPPDPAVTPTPTIGATAPAATPAPTPSATASASPDQPGVGTTVQVLNGTDDAEPFSSVVQTLRELGYDVTEAGRALNDYSETTIFATAGQEAAAAALQAADPRFTTVGENPGNLSAEIDVHVVVGSDWDAAAGAGGATEGPTETTTEG